MSALLRRMLRQPHEERIEDGADGAAAAAAPATPPSGEGKPPEGDAKPAAKAPEGKAPEGKAPEGKPAPTDEGPGGTDWREKLAKGDDAKLKRLGRYADPTVVADSLFQLQERISRGELRSTLPKDATSEQVAKWRTEQGIPEAPEKYDLGGLKVPDQDKPIIDSFLKSAHAANTPVDIAKQTIQWYYAEVERQTEQRAEMDKAAAREAEDRLREDWGNSEYRANLNSVKGLLATAPESVRDRLMYGRLSDGKPILADADTVKYLLSLALEINPATSLDLPAGSNHATAIDDEIKAIEDKMRKDRKAYNADTKMQERYRDLLTAKEKVRSRS